MYFKTTNVTTFTYEYSTYMYLLLDISALMLCYPLPDLVPYICSIILVLNLYYLRMLLRYMNPYKIATFKHKVGVGTLKNNNNKQ